jgi:hypothetical protein
MILVVTRVVLHFTRQSLQVGIYVSSSAPLTIRYPSILIMYTGIGVINLAEYVMDEYIILDSSPVL